MPDKRIRIDKRRRRLFKMPVADRTPLDQLESDPYARHFRPDIEKVVLR